MVVGSFVVKFVFVVLSMSGILFVLVVLCNGDKNVDIFNFNDFYGCIVIGVLIFLFLLLRFVMLMELIRFCCLMLVIMLVD